MMNNDNLDDGEFARKMIASLARALIRAAKDGPDHPDFIYVLRQSSVGLLKIADYCEKSADEGSRYGA